MDKPKLTRRRQQNDIIQVIKDVEVVLSGSTDRIDDGRSEMVRPLRGTRKVDSVASSSSASIEEALGLLEREIIVDRSVSVPGDAGGGPLNKSVKDLAVVAASPSVWLLLGGAMIGNLQMNNATEYQSERTKTDSSESNR